MVPKVSQAASYKKNKQPMLDRWTWEENKEMCFEWLWLCGTRRQAPQLKLLVWKPVPEELWAVGFINSRFWTRKNLFLSHSKGPLLVCCKLLGNHVLHRVYKNSRSSGRAMKRQRTGRGAFWTREPSVAVHDPAQRYLWKKDLRRCYLLM